MAANYVDLNGYTKTIQEINKLFIKKTDVSAAVNAELDKVDFSEKVNIATKEDIDSIVVNPAE